MPGNLPGEITQLLGQWSGGDRAALDELMPLVYEELRRMAHRHMAHERPGHTLQATEVVMKFTLSSRTSALPAGKVAPIFLPSPPR